MNLQTLFKRSAKAGGKDSAMAKNNSAASASDVEVDVEAIVARAMESALAKMADANTKLVEGLVTKFIPAASPAATEKKDEGKPLTREELLGDVKKLIAESLGQHQQTTQTQQLRERYLGEKLKDLPAAYRNQLGSDPAKWTAEEQAIRDAYKADFKIAGGTVADVGGSAGAGNSSAAKKPGEGVDMSKMTPTQLMELGMKNSRPVTTPQQQQQA